MKGPIRVLVVEDDPSAQLLLAGALAELPGLELCGIAADGLEGLELVERLRPDAVLLDLIMPGMDGLSFLRALDRRDRPTVVVTCGEDVLVATPEAEEDAAATPAPEDAEASPEPTADLNVYNPVPAGAVLTLSGTHSTGITSVCYRLDGGSPTTVQGESVELEVAPDVQKLELYVIAGSGLASQWATYYLTVE